MRQLLTFTADEIVPPRAAILSNQGVPRDAASERVQGLVEEGIRRFMARAEPQAVVEDIAAADFADIYHGEGDNDERTPVEEIVPRADHLALFAVTLGQPVSDEISARFAASDLAMASMLDAVASEAADGLVTVLGRRLLADLARRGDLPTGDGVLPYSPGYCGWHITGQRRLFARLRPEEIHIELNSSCLMTPLKSVSGVLVVAPSEVHDFVNDFDCCALCTTLDCQIRSPVLLEEEGHGDPEPDR